MSITWDRAYARHKSAEREMHRRIANDPKVQERSRRYADRFGAACKQTRGNIKQAMALMAEWDAAEIAANSPVRTLVLSDNGEIEPVLEHEEDC